MAPDDRRAWIIAATVPLLREHGPEVSTRHIAEAAGVAEGTLFRVFPDKASLIQAAFEAAFDPLPTVAFLRGIDTTLDLRERLAIATRILRSRHAANAHLIGMMRHTCRPGERPGPPPAVRGSFGAIAAALVFVIGHDRDQLRRSPEITARLLLGLILTVARTEAFSSEDAEDVTQLSNDDLVSVVLDGLLLRNES